MVYFSFPISFSSSFIFIYSFSIWPLFAPFSNTFDVVDAFYSFSLYSSSHPSIPFSAFFCHFIFLSIVVCFSFLAPTHFCLFINIRLLFFLYFPFLSHSSFFTSSIFPLLLLFLLTPLPQLQHYHLRSSHPLIIPSNGYYWFLYNLIYIHCDLQLHYHLQLFFLFTSSYPHHPTSLPILLHYLNLSINPLLTTNALKQLHQ